MGVFLSILIILKHNTSVVWVQVMSPCMNHSILGLLKGDILTIVLYTLYHCTVHTVHFHESRHSWIVERWYSYHLQCLSLGSDQKIIMIIPSHCSVQLLDKISLYKAHLINTHQCNDARNIQDSKTLKDPVYAKYIKEAFSNKYS